MVTGERFAFCFVFLNYILFVCMQMKIRGQQEFGLSVHPKSPRHQPGWSGLYSRLLHPLSHMKASEWVRISTHGEI